MATENTSKRLWLEEELQPDLRWSMIIKRIMHAGRSEFQECELVESTPFGKLLVLDGKVQSAEFDEYVYHELLVHPAMLNHPNPKTVFICGGGEGATAREVLRHKCVEKLVMVDIDKVVCDFCNEHLEENKAAFADPRLELIYDDARAQLENYPGKFDVIIGDLADPVFGGPCYQLYTQEFYREVVAKKLNPGGIFVTQSGPAGSLSHNEVFTPINCTLRSVFPKVVPYHRHIPSFCDMWGWNMAFSDPDQKPASSEDMDKRIAERVSGENRFLDGEAWTHVSSFDKTTRKAIKDGKHIYTVDNPAFIHGEGIKTLV